MDTANWLITIYNAEGALLTGLIAIILAALGGHFVHRLMGEASFGTLSNTAIILGAIAAASKIDDYRIASLVPDDALRISAVATLIACGVLLALASFKFWLRDYTN